MSDSIVPYTKYDCLDPTDLQHFRHLSSRAASRRASPVLHNGVSSPSDDLHNSLCRYPMDESYLSVSDSRDVAPRLLPTAPTPPPFTVETAYDGNSVNGDGNTVLLGNKNVTNYRYYVNYYGSYSQSSFRDRDSVDMGMLIKSCIHEFM